MTKSDKMMAETQEQSHRKHSDESANDNRISRNANDCDKAGSYNKLEVSTGSESLPKPYRKIVRHLERAGIEQTPKEIATATDINWNSVRVYLRQLDRRGFVHRPRHGVYQANASIITFSTMGVRSLAGVPPRIHNLMLRGKYSKCSPKKVSFGDVVTVTVRCHRNGTCSLYVNCHGGSLDYVAWRILEFWLLNEVQFDGEAEVVRYELNDDFEGFQLDGCQALTLRAFDGSIERLYNRYGRLRSEVRPAKGTDPASVYALLKGGMTPYILTQTSYMLVKEVRSLVEAVKFANLQNLQVLQLLQQHFQRLWREES